MIWGFSRDDASKFLNIYYYKRNYENYILAKLDWGYDKFMKMAIELGMKTMAKFRLGIFGEHSGDT